VKATLEFDLSDQYEAESHEIAVQSQRTMAALHEFDNELRSMHKYQDIEWAWEVRQNLRHWLEMYDVTFE